MALFSPKNGAFVGGITRLIFDSPIPDFDLKVNGTNFHTTKDDKGYALDLNDLLPDTPIHIQVSYLDGSSAPEEVVVSKPPHDLGGMGATVIRRK